MHDLPSLRSERADDDELMLGRARRRAVADAAGDGARRCIGEAALARVLRATASS